MTRGDSRKARGSVAAGRPRASVTAPEKEVVLFAVVGASPAILTETAWALAQENPPVVPDRVVAVTTTLGHKKLRDELIQSGEWENLRRTLKAGDRLQFGDTGTHIRVITRGTQELDDIRTPADNEATADFLLEELRKLVENYDVHVIATIAGGRETMSALLYTCLSLIGRETDRLTHVLVDPSLENRRAPKFYFPRNRSEAALVQMADMPFIPMRNLFPRELGRMPGRFMRLVEKYRQGIRRIGCADVHLKVYTKYLKIEVNGVVVKLSANEQFLMLFLARRCREGAPPFRKFREAAKDLLAYRDELAAQAPKNNWGDWRRKGERDDKNTIKLDWQDDESGESAQRCERFVIRTKSDTIRKLRETGSEAVSLINYLPP